MNRYIDLIERELNSVNLPICGNEYVGVLFNAAGYSLLAGGKRLRPSLALAVRDASGYAEFGDITADGNTSEVYADESGKEDDISLGIATVLPFATAIEMLHTFSLIYDDLPAFDNDDLRRGKPSCHKRYGESTAILAGSLLTVFSFQQVAECSATPQSKLNVIRLLTDAVDTMTYGQYLDKYYEKNPPSEYGSVISETANIPNMAEPEYQILDMYRMKTGALIKTACLLGIADLITAADVTAVIKYSAYGDSTADTEVNIMNTDALSPAYTAAGSALPREAILSVAEYGERLGLAFQIVDDILDMTGDEKVLGKPPGSDFKNNKNTILEHRTIEEATGIARRETEKAAQAIRRAFGDSADVLANFALESIDRIK